MLESLAADGSSTKMSELPMKVSHYYHTTTWYCPSSSPQCIWRLTRSIPTLLPSLNVDQLLLDVHHFYEGHSSITPSTDSKPSWCTDNSILFNLVKSNMGRKVMLTAQTKFWQYYWDTILQFMSIIIPNKFVPWYDLTVIRIYFLLRYWTISHSFLIPRAHRSRDTSRRSLWQRNMSVIVL